MISKEQLKVNIGRQYAQHILKTNDSITHTSYEFGVAPNTIRRYINYLSTSSNKEDVELYNKVKVIINSRKWGKTFVRA